MFSEFFAYPDYAAGHSFYWKIAPQQAPKYPLIFEIQKSIDLDAADDDWETISEPIENQFSWQADWEKAETTRYHRYFYRCKLTTGDDKIYYSKATGLYGNLSKQDYLIIRKLMQNKVIELKIAGGVPFHLYFVDARDIRCPNCADPVTGESRDPGCNLCQGTGFINGYYGPIKMYGSISQNINKSNFNGVKWEDINAFQIVMIGNPFLRSQETILADLQNNKRYKVLQVKNLAELRQMPIIQAALVVELSKNDITYFLGTDEIPTC